jgi:hypothetical protein
MQPVTDSRIPGPEGRALRTIRRLGALAVLAIGAVHLQQYLGADYRSIPTIGPLFLLNAIGSAIVAIALFAPLERLPARRSADRAVALFALLGIAIAVGSLVALFISESGSLFGFSETGYRTAIIIAIVAEVAAVVLLSPVAALGLRRSSARPVERGTTARGRPAQRWSERTLAD